ncbi:fumarate/nitrate reduction transcriptional regulator Fnr [Snodgrassella sp. B3882]|uniref:fumarate/nitrate reduction transcriptional regulator Fnr n=1 Tax=Snodgrassella sp. B3882 TaxID=2818037 RepID=UPI003A7F4461
MKIHKQSEIVQNLCEKCSFHVLCMPVIMKDKELDELNTVIRHSKRLKKGEYLFRAGEPFKSMFAVRTGFFKTIVTSQDGRDQVTGFFMSGELLGLDGICNNYHSCDAVALEDSEVCELPFVNLEQAGNLVPSLQTHFYKLMSQEIVRNQEIMLLLGNMRAEERLAAFLVNLSQRLNFRGFAANDFILRMSREEIGSYLGLKLETVSRTLSKFQHEGLIKVEHKHIQLVQPWILHEIVLSCQKAVG